MRSNLGERARDKWLEEEGCDESLALGTLVPSCLVDGGDASLAIRAYGSPRLGAYVSTRRSYQFSNVRRGVWVGEIQLVNRVVPI